MSLLRSSGRLEILKKKTTKSSPRTGRRGGHWVRRKSRGNSKGERLLHNTQVRVARFIEGTKRGRKASFAIDRFSRGKAKKEIHRQTQKERAKRSLLSCSSTRPKAEKSTSPLPRQGRSPGKTTARSPRRRLRDLFRITFGLQRKVTPRWVDDRRGYDTGSTAGKFAQENKEELVLNYEKKTSPRIAH